MLVHSSKGRFEVMIVAPRSWRWLMSPKRSSALADEPEEEFGAGLRQGHEARFIDDEQFASGELPLQSQQPPVVLGLDHLAHDGGGGDEAGLDAALARGGPMPEATCVLPVLLGPRAMTFSRWATNSPRARSRASFLFRAGRASKSKLSGLFAAGSSPWCRHRFEAHGGRGLDPPLDHPSLAVEQFELDQPGEVADMVHALGGALPGELLVLAQHRGQLQLLQVVAQQDLRRLPEGAGHQVLPVTSAM
jgi:hypothetical protein